MEEEEAATTTEEEAGRNIPTPPAPTPHAEEAPAAPAIRESDPPIRAAAVGRRARAVTGDVIADR